MFSHDETRNAAPPPASSAFHVPNPFEAKLPVIAAPLAAGDVDFPCSNARLSETARFSALGRTDLVQASTASKMLLSRVVIVKLDAQLPVFPNRNKMFRCVRHNRARSIDR